MDLGITGSLLFPSASPCTTGGCHWLALTPETFPKKDSEDGLGDPCEVAYVRNSRCKPARGTFRGLDTLGDAQLLEAWRGGDRGCGQLLMRRHYTVVLRYFELNATWAAEDLAQRTFMVLIENPERLRDPASFRPYLLGIARRQLVMHKRAMARSRELGSFDDTAQSAPQTRMSTLMVRTQQQVILLRSLAALPSAPQLLLVLYYWQGIATPDLALHFEVNPITIRTRMTRARDRLRSAFTRMSGGGEHQVSVEQLEALMRLVVEPTH